MYCGQASKTFKPGSMRTLFIKIENIGRIVSNSLNLSSDTEKYLILHSSGCMTTGIKRHHHNCSDILRKRFYSTSTEKESIVDSNTFEKVCEETLNSLAEYVEDLVASNSKLEKADVVYGAGVLTIDLGNYGTYVINRQSPNKQIWLSSPTSGPKRFDYLVKEDCWIYKHDGQTLHSLLKREFESIIDKELQISNCSHSKL